MAEFKALIARIHGRGLKALIDFVPNHVARSHASSGDAQFGEKDDTSRFFAPNNHFFWLRPTDPGGGPPLQDLAHADGVVGPHTWSKLVQVVKHGSSGQAVRAAQTQLNVHGYGLKTDGAFGANTKSAVTAFQKKHRLQMDGVVGPQTWRTLLGTR